MIRHICDWWSMLWYFPCTKTTSYSYFWHLHISVNTFWKIIYLCVPLLIPSQYVHALFMKYGAETLLIMSKSHS